MSNAPDNVATVAQHPTVQLHFSPLACYQFAKYYQHKQDRSPELLSLLDVIEHYRCAPIAELVKEMKV